MESNRDDFFKCALFLTSDFRKLDFLRKKKLDDGTIIHIAIRKFTNDTMISHLDDVLSEELPFFMSYRIFPFSAFTTMETAFKKLKKKEIKEKISLSDINKTVRFVRLLVEIYDKGSEVADLRDLDHSKIEEEFISSAREWLEANHTYIKSASKR